MKSAIVIGATGLVGKFITTKLLADERYDKIKVFVRRTTAINNPKLEEHIVDFENIVSWRNLLSGDELYSALGTTIRKAGSKKAQYNVDFNYQYNVAKAAAENGVKGIFLVSSLGANAKSKNFYLRMKGELDEKIKLLDFEKIRIFRPSMLVGERTEKRFAETIGIKIAGMVTKLIPALKKYRPINAAIVAAAMIKSANESQVESFKIYQPEEIFEI